MGSNRVTASNYNTHVLFGLYLIKATLHNINLPTLAGLIILIVAQLLKTVVITKLISLDEIGKSGEM